MTCIVGIVDKARVHIGADSAGVSGFDLRIRRDRKVFRSGDFVIGFTSSFRMGQVLAHRFSPPTPKEGQELSAFMARDFIDGVRLALKEAGFAKIENSVEKGGVFLVGYRGHLFRVEDDFQVGESACQFDACGCGESFALGSLLETGKLPAEKRLERALLAAETFSAGVRGPFHIESI